MKLFVYKTVKCEVINVEFLSRDLPLNNSAIMVKWKCLKLLYSSKGMCRIDSQLKKLIRLKYLILETPYTFFSIFSWYSVVLHTLIFTMFSGTATFPFLAFLTFPFFVCIWGTWYSIGGLDKPLKIILYYLTLVSLWVAIYTSPIT